VLIPELGLELSGTVLIGGGVDLLDPGNGGGVTFEEGATAGSALTETRIVSFLRGIELVILRGTVLGPSELFLSAMILIRELLYIYIAFRF